jgi:hypothetical protein
LRYIPPVPALTLASLPAFIPPIKPKKPRRNRAKSGNRQTLAKQVRELAQTDTFAAALLAERGKQFSEIETLLNLYYQMLKDFRKIQAGEKTTDEKLLAGELGWTQERIAKHRAEVPKELQKFAFQIALGYVLAILLPAVGFFVGVYLMAKKTAWTRRGSNGYKRCVWGDLDADFSPFVLNKAPFAFPPPASNNPLGHDPILLFRPEKCLLKPVYQKDFDRIRLYD